MMIKLHITQAIVKFQTTIVVIDITIIVIVKFHKNFDIKKKKPVHYVVQHQQ